MVEVGKKYKVSNLYKMRKFFEIFSDEKLYPLGTKLSWSHYRELLTIKNKDAIMYYIDENIKTLEENDTVGIIICKQDNKYVIKYCSDKRIIARTYEII